MTKSTSIADPSSDIHQHPLEGEDVGLSPLQESDDSSSYKVPPISAKEEKCRKQVISSSDLLEQYKATLNEPSNHIWGRHIRAGWVTLFVGETSAGKTTFLHNLACHLAKGEEFLGLTPTHPIRVLYLDYETPPDVVAEHLTTIGTAEGWDFMKLDGENEETENNGGVAQEVQ